MRLFVLVFWAGLMGIGCASTPAPVQAPLTPQLPQTTPSPVAQTITPRRIPQMGGVCPLVYPPHEVGTVLRIPAKIMSFAMDPVMHALCACTNPGEHAVISAQIDFGSGRVETRARESPTINACLETLHVNFDPPPQNDLPGSDCIGCGPRYYGVFADSPPPPKPAGLRLMYSFLLDRSGEVLVCGPDTHAERGQCVSNVAAHSPVPDKPSCGCDSADLNCAMHCAAKGKSE